MRHWPLAIWVIRCAAAGQRTALPVSPGLVDPGAGSPGNECRISQRLDPGGRRPGRAARPPDSRWHLRSRRSARGRSRRERGGTAGRAARHGDGRGARGRRSSDGRQRTGVRCGSTKREVDREEDRLQDRERGDRCVQLPKQRLGVAGTPDHGQRDGGEQGDRERFTQRDHHIPNQRRVEAVERERIARAVRRCTSTIARDAEIAPAIRWEGTAAPSSNAAPPNRARCVVCASRPDG